MALALILRKDKSYMYAYLNVKKSLVRNLGVRSSLGMRVQEALYQRELTLNEAIQLEKSLLRSNSQNLIQTAEIISQTGSKASTVGLLKNLLPMVNLKLMNLF